MAEVLDHLWILAFPKPKIGVLPQVTMLLELVRDHRCDRRGQGLVQGKSERHCEEKGTKHANS
jgi:hypothetical protein